MKKLLYLALIVATAIGFTSCSDDDVELDEEVVVPTVTEFDYLGLFTVTYGGMELNSESGASFSTIETSSSISIKLNGISFVSGMPSLDIMLPNIPMTDNDDESYVYTANSITPTTFDGEPYDTTTLQSIDNVIVTKVDDLIAFTFDCTVSTTSMGDMVCKVEYTGNMQ